MRWLALGVLLLCFALPVAAQDDVETLEEEVVPIAEDLVVELPTPIVIVVTATATPTPVVIVVTATQEPTQPATATPVPAPPTATTQPPLPPVSSRPFDSGNIQEVIRTVPLPPNLTMGTPRLRVDANSIIPLSITYDLDQSTGWRSVSTQDRVRFGRDVLRAVRQAYPEFRGNTQFSTVRFYVGFWNTTPSSSRLPDDFTAQASRDYCDLNRSLNWVCYYPEIEVRTGIPGEIYEWTLPWAPNPDEWVTVR